MAAIFVGDLHPEVTEVLLLHRFSPAGRVQSVHICRDRKSGSSLGYAYINFQHRADAERALDMFNYELLLGKPMRVMWSRYEASAKFHNMGNIFLKNLDPSIDDLALFDTFSVFGRIVSCKVVSSDTGSTGHGYIQFESAESAELAIKQLDGKLLNDHQVTIEHFKSHKQREAEACRKWDEEREQEHVETQTEVHQKTKQGVYLYIKNLDENIDDKCLHTVFSNFGTVIKAKVIMENGCSCGFGFVWFLSPQEAMIAKKRMNGKMLGKKPVYVGVAIRRGKRQAQPSQHPMQPPCLSDNTVPEVVSLDSVPAAKPVRPVDSVPVRRALSVYSVPDLKTATIIDTVPNQEVTPTLDIVPDTKTDPSVYSVRDTETARSKDTFTDTKTAHSRDTVKDTKTAQSKDTFTDTKTAQPKDTFTDTKTAQSKDTVKDTKTAQSKDTFTDTKTAQSKDTVKDTKTAQSKDTFTDTKTAQSKDTFTDTKTAQSKDTVKDTKTAQSKDTFTDTKTAQSKDTFTDTKTAQSKETVKDTKTAQSKETVKDSKTAQSKDTFTDTKTAQSKDTFTDTKTAQSKDTFTDAKTAQSKDTFTDTKTAQSKDTFTDTKTAQSKETVKDSKTAQSKDTFTDTKTAQSRDTVKDTKTAHSRDTVKDTKTAPAVDMNLRKVLSTNIQNSEASCIDVQLDTEDELKFPPRERLTIYILESVPVDEQIRIAYDYMLPLVERIHPAQANDITWMLLEGNNNYEIMNMIGDPEHLQAQVDEMDALLKARKAGLNPEILRRMFNNCSNKKRRKKGKNKRQI